MTTLYISPAGQRNEQVVPRPRATDALGASLRGVFGDAPLLPADMLSLLQRLDGASIV